MRTEHAVIEQIARALKALSPGEFNCPEVHLGVVDDDVFDVLATHPRAEFETSLYRYPGGDQAIDAVEVNVGGVAVRAQLDARPATAEESARLDGAPKEERQGYSAAVTIATDTVLHAVS